MKKIFLLTLFLMNSAFAFTFTECEEGNDYPTDQTQYHHYAYSTHNGFLWWFENGYLQGKVLEEIKITKITETIEQITQTRVYAKRELIIENIMNSYYRNGDYVHIPVNPPETILSQRLFSCIDYNF